MSVLSAILPPTVVLVGIGAAMEASKAAGWLPITVPAPSQIAAVIPAQFADLMYHAGGTLQSAVTG